jgi:hypothetical protein
MSYEEEDTCKATHKRAACVLCLDHIHAIKLRPSLSTFDDVTLSPFYDVTLYLDHVPVDQVRC